MQIGQLPGDVISLFSEHDNDNCSDDLQSLLDF